MRDVSYKIYVSRNNVDIATLMWEEKKSPNLVFDAQRDIKSSLKGSFLPAPGVDFAKDELRPVITINGVEMPLGVYRVGTYGESGNEFGRRVDIEAYDRCYLCRNAETEDVLFLQAGSMYISEIEKLLTKAGIAVILADECKDTLATDREDWDIGTNYLKIINQLLEEIGFEPLWFDANGVARLQKYRAPDADNIIRNYSSTDIRRLPMSPIYKRETDLFGAPNVFRCVCSNADRDKPLVATSINDYVLSATSTVNRGLRIHKTVNVSEIASQEALQTYADRLRDESLLSTELVSIQVFASAEHGLGDVVSIDHPDIGGIYHEQGWSITLKTGNLMTLNLQRTVLK